MRTRQRMGEFRKLLERRFLEVREAIREELLDEDNEHCLELAGRMTDVENSSLAELLTDVSVADIDRLVDEAHEIDAALLRIAHGSYGRCTECGEDIDAARLRVYPTAKRCLTCQLLHEQRRHPSGVRASL